MDKIGPTGQFPDGKLNPDDEGGLTYRVAADIQNGLVRIEFGGPVAWLALQPEQAVKLGDSLINKANIINEHKE